MGTVVLDELSVDIFLNKGPFLNFKNTDDMFKTESHLGVPFEMEIHSSINGMYRYGYISIFDDGGVRESLPLTGNEIISIMYKNAFNISSNTSPIIMHFNIFDIEEIPYNQNAFDSKKFTTKLLKLHLIECPFYLMYNQNLWQKTYGKDTKDPKTSIKVSVDKIFEKHITEDLKIYNPDQKSNLIELNINKMSTKLHFVIPSWKSQMTFSYLLDFCRDENGSGNVKFYNTSNIENGKITINLQSLNQMIKKSKMVEFTSVDANTLSDLKNNLASINNRALNQILNHKFVFYDLSSVSSGMAGGYMINMDYNKSKYYTLFDTYEESNKKKGNSYFSNYALWRNDISNENTKQYFIGEFPKEEAKNYLNNKITKNKFQIRCEIATYVDETIQPGDKILATFIAGIMEHLKGVQQGHLFDEHMTDEWIVEDVIDSYRNGKALRKMVIVKDSFFNLYDQSAGIDSKKQVIPKVKITDRDVTI